MQRYDMQRFGNHVLVTNADPRAVDYLVNVYNAQCLKDPFNACAVPNITIDELFGDEYLMSYDKTTPKKPSDWIPPSQKLKLNVPSKTPRSTPATTGNKPVTKQASTPVNKTPVNKTPVNKTPSTQVSKTPSTQVSKTPSTQVNKTPVNKTPSTQVSKKPSTSVDKTPASTSVGKTPSTQVGKSPTQVSKITASSQDEDELPIDITKKSAVRTLSFFKDLTLEDAVGLYLKDKEIAKKFDDIPDGFENLKALYDLNAIMSFEDLIDLLHQLNKTADRKRKVYQGTKVDNFKIGDRVILNKANYVVSKVTDDSILLDEVNVLGRAVRHPGQIEAFLTYYISKKRKVWFWSDEDFSDTDIEPDIDYVIIRGILLYNEGPIIESLDSIFLKWETLPEDKREDANPHYGLIVSVQNPEITPGEAYMYLVTSTTKGGQQMELKYIGTNRKLLLPKVLNVFQQVYFRKNTTLWHSDTVGDVTIILGSWEEGLLE
jgi:hypothetical protein